METKVCAKCKETKPVSQFYKKAIVKDGFDSYCKVCQKGYVQRWKNLTSDERSQLYKKLSVTERFLSRVVPVTESGCWLWDGKINSYGYGDFKIDKKPVLAHRFSWQAHRGEIPDGMSVLHKCDVRNCVNPDHLFLGTHQDNMADMVQKGRQGRKKLTNDEVAAIRAKYPNATYESLADQYNVSASAIQSIITRRTWKHISNEERPR